MLALRTTATSVLRHLLDGQPDTPAKVNFAWQIVAGPALARASSTRWSDDGVLRVRPRSVAWAREIARARPLLVERLRQLLGPEAIRSIVIDADPSEPTRRGRPRS